MHTLNKCISLYHNTYNPIVPTEISEKKSLKIDLGFKQLTKHITIQYISRFLQKKPGLFSHITQHEWYIMRESITLQIRLSSCCIIILTT